MELDFGTLVEYSCCVCVHLFVYLCVCVRGSLAVNLSNAQVTVHEIHTVGDAFGSQFHIISQKRPGLSSVTEFEFRSCV